MKIYEITSSSISSLNEVSPSESPSGLTFFGSPCTKDCSGHIAGYKWAKRKNKLPPVTGDPRTPSFFNGANINATQRASNIHTISTGIKNRAGQWQKFAPQ